jgi:hypothetical protein
MSDFEVVAGQISGLIVEPRFRPTHEAKTARLGVRKSVLRFLLLLMTSGLATSLVWPIRIQAEVAGPLASDPGSDTIQPLDLKPGCWQMRLTTTPTLSLPRATPDTYRGMMPNATSEELTRMVAQVNAQADQQEAEARKPRVQTVSGCHPEHVDISRLIVGAENGPPNYKCTRTVHSTARELHLVQRCVSLDGKTNSEETTDIVSADPLSATGKTRSASDSVHAITITFVSKWIGEAKPHPPLATPTTDLDGVRPKGPVAVAGLDPYRVVASFEGRNWMAAQARVIFNLVPWETVKHYGPQPDMALQQIYMHKAIADEVLIKRISISEPLRRKLAQAGIVDPDPQNPFGHLVIINEERSNWEDVRERILWEAYFDQATSEAEKAALLRRVQEKYKITVVDRDFFDFPLN